MSDRTPHVGWRALARVDWMMVFPIVAVCAWLLGREAMAVALVVGMPICVALRLHTAPGEHSAGRPAATGDMPTARAGVLRLLDEVLDDCAKRERTTAVLLVEVDDLHIGDGGWDVDAGDRIMDRVMQRVNSAMRGQDSVLRIGDHGMIAVLAPTRRADLDVLMALVDRVQAAVAKPISIGGRALRVRCCIGICSEAMAPARNGAAMLAAAECALRIARRQGEDAVRAFNPDIQTQVEIDQRLALRVEDALENGEIRPWFQPQVDTRTGRIAGFEALARWHHPELGVLLPDQFLGTIVSAGRASELGEIILRGSIASLLAWDEAGLDVPCVGVNVSLEQLTDPRLAERIVWQLDRYDVRPGRIAIEILETVTLRDGDEAIMRNLNALREAGFRLDLDDFGTGAASIAHIVRFGVHRIKIDRSFVHGIAGNPAQREVVAAILGLADSLSIDTLAEGVETAEDQQVLAQMGCPHVQGFAVARAMPMEETIPWAREQPWAAADVLRLMQPRGSA